MSLRKKIAETWLEMSKDKERDFVLLWLDLINDKISSEDFWEKCKRIPAYVIQHVNMLHIMASIVVLSEAIEKLEKRVVKIEAKI